MPSKHSLIGVAFGVLVLTAGCTRNASEMVYCDPNDQSWNWREGAMHIDLDRRLISGGDTSSAIYPFATGQFVGFEAEFPLLLFSDAVDPSEIRGDIVVKDVLFRVFPVEGTFGDLWLITARPREAGSELAWRQHSTVLYSSADGVLSMSFSDSIGEAVYPVNYIACGKRTLRYDDLRRLADSIR